jgi:hypothetical protein
VLNEYNRMLKYKTCYKYYNSNSVIVVVVVVAVVVVVVVVVVVAAVVAVADLKEFQQPERFSHIMP